MRNHRNCCRITVCHRENSRAYIHVVRVEDFPRIFAFNKMEQLPGKWFPGKKCHQSPVTRGQGSRVNQFGRMLKPLRCNKKSKKSKKKAEKPPRPPLGGLMPIDRWFLFFIPSTTRVYILSHPLAPFYPGKYTPHVCSKVF